MSGTPEEFTAEDQAAMDAMRDGEAIETPADDAAAAVEVETTPGQPVEPDQPEPQPEPQVDPNKPPDGYVPHSAMHQERERRKQAERENEEFRQRLAALEAAQTPKQDGPPPLPDAILDPEGAAKWHQDRLAEANERWAEQERQVKYQQRQSQARQYEDQFAAATPDYADATQHLYNGRVAELTAQGYDQAAIGQILSQDANAIYDNAIAQGKNPAQVLYEVAKLRGYAAPAPAVPDQAATQMQAKAAAVANAGTLATAGGPSGAGEYTMESLSKMSPEELAKVPKEVFTKVMGG